MTDLFCKITYISNFIFVLFSDLLLLYIVFCILYVLLYGTALTLSKLEGFAGKKVPALAS